MNFSTYIFASILSFSLISYTFSNEVKPKRFNYIDPVNGGVFSLMPKEKKYSFMDVIEPAQYCEKNDQHYCFRINFISFYVPKSLTASKSWRVNEIDYLSSKFQDMKLLGSNYRVTKIKSLQNGIAITFLYSRLNGLLGLEFSDDKMKKVYLLRETYGFGSKNQ